MQMCLESITPPNRSFALDESVIFNTYRALHRHVAGQHLLVVVFISVVSVVGVCLGGTILVKYAPRYIGHLPSAISTR